MLQIQIYVLFFTFVSPSQFVASQYYDDLTTLLDDMLAANVYDKRVRPIVKQNESLIVTISLSPVAITDIDEVKESLSTAAYLDVVWKDEFLRWTPSMYNDIDHFYISQKDIWIPDIALKNGFTKLQNLGEDSLLTTVENNGIIIWKPFEVFQTQCPIDTKYFPFDQQTCNITFGVWTSASVEIELRPEEGELWLGEYQTNGQWDMVKTSAHKILSINSQSVVTFSLKIKRKPQYIMVNVVLPIIMLSILSACTFLIPAESGEKMGYAMTLYLSFVVFLTIVSSLLPENSTMSLLSTYLVVLLAIGTTIIIITAIQLRLHHLDSSREIPRFVRCLVRMSSRLQCRHSVQRMKKSNRVEEMQTERVSAGSDIEMQDLDDKTEIHSGSSNSKSEIAIDDSSWADVTSAIDFYCFWLFSIAIVISTVVLFVSGVSHSSEIK
ncbi:acetylcholine receptor subunit alpha-1-B-like [Pecten maximus]|uniref:acetylcholine receptor subunit alpha-1-B-like n=1 Tax=Pecten maximus TaxID=6579 RepID=UPI001458FCFE|nr:acetylcholine receptor subunit alpha-1-B-like [Pecten maximus]